MSPILTGVNISRTKDNAISAFFMNYVNKEEEQKDILISFFMLCNIYKALK